MNKDLSASLAWAGGLLALALGGTLLRQLGYMDQETLTRVVIGANGVLIFWLGNRMPKAFVPSACARQVRRVGGWSMALAGIVYAGLWATAPIPVATVGGCAAVLAGMAVMFGYAFALRGRTA